MKEMLPRITRAGVAAFSLGKPSRASRRLLLMKNDMRRSLLSLFFLAFVANLSAQGGGSCNPTTGLAAPVPVCTPASPCTMPEPDLGVSVLTAPTQVPVCHTTKAGRPFFDDGSPNHSVDAQGVDRYACVFRPAGASRISPRPLIIFFHGGLGSASTIYNEIALRSKAVGFDP